MKHTGIGYLQLGIHGQPAPETSDKLDDTEWDYDEEFLCVGTGVEENYFSCFVTIRYLDESLPKERWQDLSSLRSWTMEMCARNNEEATRLAIREFHMINSIAGEILPREIFSVSVHWNQ